MLCNILKSAAVLLESCPSPDQDVSVLTFDSLHPTTHADYKTGLEGILLELWAFLEFLATLVSCSKWGMPWPQDRTRL